MGYFLGKQGRRFAILDASDSIGAAWRTRWDSLVLFTPRRYDSLPGLPFPGDPDGYPGRDEVISYLERYAATFELPVELNSPVKAVAPSDGGFVLNLGARTLESEQVVVATGPFQVPNVPAVRSGTGAGGHPDAQYRLPGSKRCSSWNGSGGRRGQHRIPDSRRTIDDAHSSTLPLDLGRHRCRSECWGAMSSGGSRRQDSSTRPSTRASDSLHNVAKRLSA